MNIAIIPARGGSKRIPGKNIRPFAGRPMLGWPIRVARQSGLFDHILVSTDDPEIADCADKAGAEVPFVRPAHLADDYSSTADVMAHAVQWTIDQGWAPEAVCCIYATAPFLRVADLEQGLHVLQTGSWQYTLSATQFDAPIFRAFQQQEHGGLEMFFPQYYASRSQDLPTALHDAAQFYWGRPEAWLGRKQIFAPHSCPIILPRWLVQDIDTEEDWKMAERMAEKIFAQMP